MTPGISIDDCGDAMILINNDRVEKYFKDLAGIPSPSWKEEKVIGYLEAFAKKRKLALKKYECGKSFNVMISLDGGGKKEPILFAAHTDTVTPCDKINVQEDEKKFYTDGNSILGGDDKAAVAAFLEAIDYLLEKKPEYGKIDFLFTCAEEVGLCGMKGFDVSKTSAKKAFVLDSDGSVGSATIAAPYQIIMEVKLKGKAAHAGMEPEKGISAVYAAAEIINSIPQGRIDAETTTNVGRINGGSANNIVAENLNFELECRSLNKKKLDSLENKIVTKIKSVSKKRKVKAEIKIIREYSGYSFSLKDPMLVHFEKAAALCGINPSFKKSGGGSDTNILNANNIKALNLSVGMMKVHTKEEFLLKKDLHKSAQIVAALIIAN